MSDPGRIVVSGLTKTFGAVKALNGLSFVVEPGTIAGFLGPNGAGKTTTLRILLGLVAADAGAASIGGRRYAALPTPTRVVGAALEATGFHPARTGRAHLRVACTVNGYAMARADEVLDLVGLSAAGRRSVGGYSLGMRQRLALGQALLGDPAVLVLDEPANGLDPEGIAWMRALLRGLARQGCTVLVSSHALSEVSQLVDNVVIINRGRCVHQSRLADLSTVDGPVVVIRASPIDKLSEALTRAGVRFDQAGADELRVTGRQPDDVGRLAYAAGVEVLWLTTEASDLEHLFLALTSDGAAIHSGG